MSYAPSNDKFPEIAKKEARSIISIDNPELPEGVYALFESYCDEKECDCRRVFFDVYSKTRNESVAVIAYGWENLDFYKNWLTDKDPKMIKELKGPILNLWSHQSELAPVLLKKMRFILKDRVYIQKIKRHYHMFRNLINREHSDEAAASQIRKTKIGRNDPCPCGIGKKYKRCCIGEDNMKG